MNANLEKILKMLEMEAIKIREEGDFETMNTVKLEIDRFIKTEYAKLEEKLIQQALNALDGEEELVYNGHKITFKTGSRFAFDNAKLRNYLYKHVLTTSQREEYDELNTEEKKEFMDDLLKGMFYSHQIKKPKKPKIIKQ